MSRPTDSPQDANDAAATSERKWQHFRMLFTIVVGAIVLGMGIHQDDAAIMTVGAGMVGFSPASKGP
jgi:hypothetical protein